MKIKHFDTSKELGELKQDYKKLALEYHPDRPNGSTEKMQEINAEFEYVVKNYNSLSGDYVSIDGAGFDFDSFFNDIYGDLSRQPVNMRTIFSYVIVGVADIMTAKIRQNARGTKNTD